MRFHGSMQSARVSGIAAKGLSGLAGTVQPVFDALAVYRKIMSAPDPTPSMDWPGLEDYQVLTEPDTYLHYALESANYGAVRRWYLIKLDQILDQTTQPGAFWDISKINLQNYANRTLTAGDLKLFTNSCILSLVVADMGNKVGFGFGSWSGEADLAMKLRALSGNDGQYNWYEAAENLLKGYNWGFTLGWVKEPSKHTASRIMVAIGAAFMGAAAFQAISAAGAAAGSEVGGAASAATAGGEAAAVGAGTVAVEAAIPAGIETVIVAAPAASAVTAGTIGAGLATGAIVAAAPPAMSTPEISPEVLPDAPPAVPIESVVVEAAPIVAPPIPAATIGAGLAAGTIAATTAPPIVGTAQPPIETVVVEAPPIETPPVDPEVAAIIGAATIPLTQPIIEMAEPTLPEIDTEPSLTDRIKNGLADAVADFGVQYVSDRLAELLTQLLGRPPTDAELNDAGTFIGRAPPPIMAGVSPWLMLLFMGGVVVAALKEDKKQRRHQRRVARALRAGTRIRRK